MMLKNFIKYDGTDESKAKILALVARAREKYKDMVYKTIFVGTPFPNSNAAISEGAQSYSYS